MKDQEIYSGLIRLHILYQAQEQPVYGVGIRNELKRFGYQLSASTLYPILHRLEIEGYLSSYNERTGGRNSRRLYLTTEKGNQTLAEAKTKIKELFGELSKIKAAKHSK